MFQKKMKQGRDQHARLGFAAESEVVGGRVPEQVASEQRWRDVRE